jgi:hypothetical protein
VLRGGGAAVARGEGSADVAGEGVEGERGLGGFGVGGRRVSLLPLHGRGVQWEEGSCGVLIEVGEAGDSSPFSRPSRVIRRRANTVSLGRLANITSLPPRSKAERADQMLGR